MTRDGLRIDDLTVRFGGTVAVDRLSLDAPIGRITGLIGPNGAGKTTAFNACSGLLRPHHGSIWLFGKDVTTMGVPQRARLGLGRTFQVMELFGPLTVQENVEMGREGSMADANPLNHFITTRTQRQLIEQSTEEALALCGLTQLSEARVDTLPTGQQRLVELARALAGEFTILLLDEPASGLDEHETAAFSEVLANTAAARDIGVLLVEHDVDLVMDVCEHIYVLDFGKLIFAGDPSETQQSAAVRDAYLGVAS